MSEFARLHPTVCFVYFAAFAVLAVTFNHPVCVLLSFLGSAAYLVLTDRAHGVRFLTHAVLPLYVLASLANPLFSHAGITVLAYFPNGNPLTLESVYYGLDAAGILVAMLCIGSCISKTMTEEKWICVCGRVLPSLSLVLSMSFRFVPRFSKQAKELYETQSRLSLTRAGMFSKIGLSLRVLGILVTKTFENAIDTAFSMKARGYGLPCRTSFSVYRFGVRDYFVLAFTLIPAAVVVAERKMLAFRFYPSVKGTPLTFWHVVIFILYGAFCFLPFIYEETERLRWKYYAPKI